MSGGFSQLLRAHGVRLWAVGLSVGVVPWPGLATSSAFGAKVDERSVVIASEKAELDDAAAIATDDSSSSKEDSLKPIAQVSDNEPELAEPPAKGKAAPEPTSLADEYAPVATPGESPATAGSEDHPTTEDVCIDEPAPDAASDDAAVDTKLHPVIFRGIEPGVSTRADVVDQWGEPATEENSVLGYEFDAFPSVSVHLNGKKVVSISVQLFAPTNPAKLAAKLQMVGIHAATIEDADGKLVSTLYPERGVIFHHEPVAAALATDAEPSGGVGKDAVYEIEAGVVKADAFLLRAETTSARAFSRRSADLETAIELDSKNIEARRQLAEIKLAVGEAAEAERLASEACDLAPRSDACRLTWARSLKYLARYEEAVKQTQAVLSGTTASQLERAAALLEMGKLAALGSREVQERSVPMCNKAIAIADPLAASEKVAERQGAGLILVDAHLTIAERIAAGDWQDKERSVAKWIGRASGLAEHMIASGEADQSLRLEVAVSALTASARLEPPINPELWVKEAEQAAGELQESTADASARDQLNWKLGMAYFYAAEIMHRRSQPDEALNYGQLAEATLVPAADARKELPDTQYILGRLYFQIGAVHAVHFQDHDTACQWYDKAAESLMRPVPLTAQTSPSQHGDALVSMGVSYWQSGARDRAYSLTDAGLQLIEQGVKEGLIAQTSLDVPRKNLAAMDRALGKTELADAEEPASEDAPRVATAPRAKAKSTKQSSSTHASKSQIATSQRSKSQSSKTQAASAQQKSSRQVAKSPTSTQSGGKTQVAASKSAKKSLSKAQIAKIKAQKNQIAKEKQSSQSQGQQIAKRSSHTPAKTQTADRRNAISDETTQRR